MTAISSSWQSDKSPLVFPCWAEAPWNPANSLVVHPCSPSHPGSAEGRVRGSMELHPLVGGNNQYLLMQSYHGGDYKPLDPSVPQTERCEEEGDRGSLCGQPRRARLFLLPSLPCYVLWVLRSNWNVSLRVNVYSSIWLSIHPVIHLSIHPPIQSSIQSSIYPIIHPSAQPFVHPLISSI